MTDVPPGGTNAQTIHSETHPPFPATRLLYAFGFAVVAWFVIWVLFVLAFVQFVVLAVNGHQNKELKTFSLSLVQYLMELLAFIIFVRDERPFPIGPFPKYG